MHEGTNYIKYLQNKVKQLQAKRDELMKLSNLSSPFGPPESTGSFVVVVHPCSGGVQIKCSYSLKCVFPLSRVLNIVLKEGLNVVNCVSIKTDDMFIHTILSEVPYYILLEINLCIYWSTSGYSIILRIKICLLINLLLCKSEGYHIRLIVKLSQLSLSMK